MELRNVSTAGDSVVIDGVKVDCLNPTTGIPIKSKLPDFLGSRLATRNQWLELGYIVPLTAKSYPMHASENPRSRVYDYFLDDDVVALEIMPICLFCGIRYNNKYCPVAGDHVKLDQHCSEWRLREGDL